MVLSILIATITAPALLGSQEAIRQSQSKEKREEHRARRCNLIVRCVKSASRSKELDGRPIVLEDGKLWVDVGKEGAPPRHAYAGYYLPYPDSKHEGLVTTITDIAPIMNWVYVDRNTLEVKYGVRADAQPHLTGPFDCTRQDRRMTFDGWEGWCAVEEQPGLWALYFDANDDGLSGVVAPGTKVLEIELARKEKRFKKDAEMRQQDQTTKRKVHAQEDAPVDEPLSAEAQAQIPGPKDVQNDDMAAAPAPLKPFNMPESIFPDSNPLPKVEPLPERPGDRPFQIPKSIFNDVPVPLNIRPNTPPPAYSNTLPPGEPLRSPLRSPPLKSPITMSVDDTIGTSSIMEFSRPTSTREGQQGSFERDFDGDRARRTPSSNRRPSSPSPPAGARRTTPKLNRNSGTRALAQAQKFEALASDSTRNAGIGRQASKSSLRSNSYASSSEYSVDEPKLSVEPRSDPVVRPQQRYGRPPENSRTRGTVRESSSTRPQDNTSQDKSPDAVDPAVFGGAPPKSRSKLGLQPQRSQPGSQTLTSRNMQRAPSQQSDRRANGSRTVREQVSSKASTPRNGPIRSAFSSSIATEEGTNRPTLARTMTSGKSNQGMANRMAPPQRRNPSVGPRPGGASSRSATTLGRKTTSALFREIDELVSQETSGPKPSTPGSGVNSPRLKRADTTPVTPRLRAESSTSRVGRERTSRNNTQGQGQDRR